MSWAAHTFAVSVRNASLVRCGWAAASATTASHSPRNPTRYASISEARDMPSRARAAPNSVATVESNAVSPAIAAKIGRMFAAQPCATTSNWTDRVDPQSGTSWVIAQASTAASSSVRRQSTSATWTTCCFTLWPVSCTFCPFTCSKSPLILGKLDANEQAAIVLRERRWRPSLSVDDESKLGPAADVEDNGCTSNCATTASTNTRSRCPARYPQTGTQRYQLAVS